MVVDALEKSTIYRPKTRQATNGDDEADAIVGHEKAGVKRADKNLGNENHAAQLLTQFDLASQ